MKRKIGLLLFVLITCSLGLTYDVVSLANVTAYEEAENQLKTRKGGRYCPTGASTCAVNDGTDD